MKYLTRTEVVKKLMLDVPGLGKNTINKYIDLGIIKNSGLKTKGKHMRVAQFSESYINKILRCAQVVHKMDWKKVQKLSPIEK
jgi:hypothetical protein